MSLPPAIGAVPHRRHDPLRDEWVLVSSGRTRRPWQGRREEAAAVRPPAYDPTCYLCPGNERAGGVRNPAYRGTWSFENDFAALRPETPPGAWSQGLLRAEAEAGSCRVLCYSPHHDRTLGSLAPAEVRAVVDRWAEESATLGERWPWVQVFENRGPEMGASNPHPHGQIWAGEALPRDAVREDRTQREHRERTGSLLLRDVLDQEAGGPRIVEENDGWVVLVPFWATWPYEILLLPRFPAARLPELSGEQRDALGRIVRALYRRYDALFGRPLPFSFGWHQAPFGRDGAHWLLHAHAFPPLLGPDVRKFMVGYELLSEAQRDLDPETAAERLRAVDPGERAG